MMFNIVTTNHDDVAAASLEPMNMYMDAMLRACGHQSMVSKTLYQEPVNIYYEHFINAEDASSQLRIARQQYGCRIGVVATELMVGGNIPYARHGCGYSPEFHARRMGGFSAVLPEIDFLWAFLEKTAEEYTDKVNVCEFLPYGCTGLIGNRGSMPKKDIDVVFFGRATPHRRQVLSRFANSGLKVAAVGQDFDSQIVPDYVLNSLIDRARIGLNLTLHAKDDAPAGVDPRFVSGGRVVPMLQRGTMVVSEDIPCNNPYRNFMASAEPDDLVDLCRDYLRDDKWAIEGAKNAANFCREMDVRKICGPVIERTLKRLQL